MARLVSLVLLGALAGSGSVPMNAAARTGGNPPSGAIGRDVGFQSCSQPLATDVSFGVVGVNAGRPYFPSSCLSLEYTWATSLTYRPQYYMNLANPGRKSPNWGQGGPRGCDRTPKYDAGCGYDYGWRAAKAAWGYVAAVGAPGRGRWWVDVETDNTWAYSSKGIAANRMIIRGAVNYLRHKRHVTVGVYTQTIWWALITGGARFSKTPVWGGGAGSKRNARSNCKPVSITGGPALMAQWIRHGVDHDIIC
ncbi:MAG TPA: hypothetical protein VHB69_06880 [Mycobacteriales bacterium]|nr:hypothetical protein [Mycobacteriales bacterium]